MLCWTGVSSGNDSSEGVVRDPALADSNDDDDDDDDDI